MDHADPESSSWREALQDSEDAKAEYQRAVDDATQHNARIPEPFSFASASVIRARSTVVYGSQHL